MQISDMSSVQAKYCRKSSTSVLKNENDSSDYWSKQSFWSNVSTKPRPNESRIFSQKSTTLTESNKQNVNISRKEYPTTPQIGNDLFIVLRLPLAVGACFGLVPIRGLFNGKYCFSWFHIRTFITAFVAIGLLLQTVFIGHHFAVLIIKGKNSAGDLILIISGVWFYLVGLFICLFFLVKSKHLCLYFDKWIEISNNIAEYSEPDKHVVKHINAITAVLLLNCIGENVLYHFHAMEDERRKTLNLSKFLYDYYNSNQYIYPFFNYSPVVSMCLLVTNKIATFAWNFGDLILILVSRALFGKYKALNKFMECKMETHGSIRRIRKGAVLWRKVRNNFLQITELLQEVNCLLSPLIWLSFTTDIFFICRQIYEGLAPRPLQSTLINKIYVIWSLILLIGRFIGVNMMAATMSEEAHSMFKVTQYCHPDEYDIEVTRLERFLNSRIVGITGTECFIITRSFLIKIISVIFTLEVVLLQNAHLTVG